MKIIITEEQLNKIISQNDIIVYHGSNHKFDLFKNDFVGGEKANDAQGPGIYFTDNIDDASHYGKYLYTVKLTPNKILSDRNKNGITPNLVVKLIKMCPDWEMNAYDWNENLNKGLNLSVKAIFENDNAKDIITEVYTTYYSYRPILYVKNCTQLGIDGISHKNIWGDGVSSSQHYIIYNPSIVEILKIEEIN